MITKKTVFLMVGICLHGFACNVIATESKFPSKNPRIKRNIAQSVTCTIHNSVESVLHVKYFTLNSGSWSKAPNNIGALQERSYSNKGSGSAGPENYVIYEYQNYKNYGTLKIYIDLSNWLSKFTYRLEYSQEFEEYFNVKASVTNTLFHYELIISLEVKVPNSFNILISADPQPYRIFGGNDPNKDKYLWETQSQAISDKILEKNQINQFHFGIINGDLTEYGRKSQLESFEDIYTNRFPFKLLLGLGNHDYQNNINNCWDLRGVDQNGCAANLIKYMNNKLKEYDSILNNYNSDFKTSAFRFTGSMAYRFDYGNYTFFQLQNHPSYEVTFLSARSYRIRNSFQWLEEELGVTNKNVVLCLHDMDRYFNYVDNYTNAFKEIINKYNIKLIFSGHTHHYDKFRFGTATVFTNHALFDGGFFTVHFENNCVSVFKHNDESYGQVCFKS